MFTPRDRDCRIWQSIYLLIMSHFIGLVFGDNIEDNLEPYYEGNEVEPYIKYTKEEAIAEAKTRVKETLEYLEKREPENKEKIDKWKSYETDEDFYEYAKKWGYDLDEEGNLISTYNPKSKWDWYATGGRWNGYLPTGDTGEYTTNQCSVSQVNWDKYFEEHNSPYCFVTTEGEWHEKGRMGWWGISTGELDENVWSEEFTNYLNSVSDDTLVTAIDFHI